MIEEIRRARDVIAGVAIRTPLVRLDVDADAEIWLKLELLQPVRSFKIRGAANAILQATDAELASGVFTASAGNMAQGVCVAARIRGVPATIVVPEHAPQAKLDAIARYGGRVIKVAYDEWWNTMITGSYEGLDGMFVHPVDNRRVMAGNGTIGLELLEQLDDFDAVVVPWGGGGLFTGIASALAAERPAVQMWVAEPDTAAPVTASRAAGAPVEVEYSPSFVDGSGARALIPGVWQRAEHFVDGSVALSLEATAAALRLVVARARVVPEGAGALPVAAALSGRIDAKKIVCIVSGGNIDTSVLARILEGETP
ncbi:MAG TPA: threonine/serine dehydratase [Gaiellaceae bacterium]|nr:threonine/serine dehydratase [Gaiellaceae bacterium]